MRMVAIAPPGNYGERGREAVARSRQALADGIGVGVKWVAITADQRRSC